MHRFLKLMIIGVFAIRALPVLAQETSLRHARPLFSKEQVSTWVSNEIRAVNPNLKWELVDSERWSRYVNYEHFVSLEAEGVPAGYQFDYNWPEAAVEALKAGITPATLSLAREAAKKSGGKPSAEVTETGKFMLWWEKCNFYVMSEDQCKSFIHLAVTHEAYHFLQWQRLAVSALQQVASVSGEIPYQSEDLKKTARAYEVFMQKWADIAHYQCREVEVYTTQLLNGQMGKDVALDRVRNNLKPYFDGCSKSSWSEEFKPYLGLARELFKKYGVVAN